MRLRAKWWCAALVIVGTSLCALAICTSSTYQACKAEYRKHAAEEQQKKGRSPVPLSFSQSARSTVNCVVDSIDAIEGILTLLATIAIAAFTATIWRVNQNQLTHGRQIERAYISGGGIPSHIKTNTLGGPTAIFTGKFEVHINNHGKTPGRLLEIAIEFCEADNIPPHPIYNPFPHRDWIGPGTQSRPIRHVPIPPDLKNPVVYGRFYYRDIFSEIVLHSCGFIQDIDRSTGGSSPLLPPSDEYTSNN